MKNKKYLATKKNKGIVPKCYDERLLYVAVGCQQCEECRKKKKNEWQVRLQEEIKTNKGIFVTLTFSEESLKKLEKKYAKKNLGEIPDANTIATFAMRRFLERWRSKFGKSVHHWFITELGDEETERIHMHGILFTKENKRTIDKIWKYGNNYYGYKCDAQTINYCIKYITKVDQKHPEYKQKILCSKGIGKGYMNTWSAQQNQYNRHNGEERTNETYRLSDGRKQQLPIYYRNKIYSDGQREKLWQEKLNKGVRYILGKKYSFKTNDEMVNYFRELDWYQTENERKGYRTDITWNSKKYMSRIEKLNKFSYDISLKLDNMKIEQIKEPKQLQFHWMDDRAYIDKKAELSKQKRAERRNEWCRENLNKNKFG